MKVVSINMICCSKYCNYMLALEECSLLKKDVKVRFLSGDTVFICRNSSSNTLVINFTEK